MRMSYIYKVWDILTAYREQTFSLIASTEPADLSTLPAIDPENPVRGVGYAIHIHSNLDVSTQQFMPCSVHWASLLVEYSWPGILPWEKS